MFRKLIIREQDPLKQGLKLAPILGAGMEVLIREQDPLKQGLKHDIIRMKENETKFVSKIH